MRVAPLARVTVIVVLGVLASLGLALGRLRGCLDGLGSDRLRGHCRTGLARLRHRRTQGSDGEPLHRHRDQHACAKARALTAKLIRLRAPGRGFDKKILSGYTCLNPISNAPAGSLFFGGGCVVGAAVIPVPAAGAFNWHPCQLVKTRTRGTLHPTCTGAYYTLG